MCGIVGYIGNREAVPVILDGLHRLAYRGYDSSGIAVLDSKGNLGLRRASGKLCNLETAIRLNPVDGAYGIGHTRWATHGRPTEENAHPHRDCTGDVVIVHNGIVENYHALKRELEAEGHLFRSETDTEVIAHLVEKYFKGNLEDAVRNAATRLRGSFAVAVISRSDPGKIVVARLGPPAVIGLGDREYFIASDIPAILGHTRDVLFLTDGDVAVLTPDGVHTTNFVGQPVLRDVSRISWEAGAAEKGAYKHFMLKEIYEQPRALRDTIAGRIEPETGSVRFEDIGIASEEFRLLRHVRIVACGTSWHAAQAGKFMIEELARIPVEVDYGSEFRYRNPLISDGTLTLVISQSGETADTLAAQREAKAKGSRSLAICNVIGSTISREATGTILTHAGPEIGVASTKAFTSQLASLFLLAMHIGQARNVMTEPEARRFAREFNQLPAKVEQALSQDAVCRELARKLHRASAFLYLGRGIHFPIALEGALKLKEISYIHAEGHPAGEMKHGPNALIDGSLPVVVLATHDPTSELSLLRYEKTLSNIQEVKARDGVVVAVANEGDRNVPRLANHVIEIPSCPELLLPILEIVPLQLLAYHIALRRGCDVDQPRNLAKSVTVE